MSDWQTVDTAPEDELVLTIWDGVDTLTGAPVRYYAIALLYDGEWFSEDGDFVDEPTHWMPLPEPPK